LSPSANALEGAKTMAGLRKMSSRTAQGRCPPLPTNRVAANEALRIVGST